MSSIYGSRIKQLQNRISCLAAHIDNLSNTLGTKRGSSIYTDPRFMALKQYKGELQDALSFAMSGLGTMYNGYAVRTMPLSLPSLVAHVQGLVDQTRGKGYHEAYLSLVEIVCYSKQGLNMVVEEENRLTNTLGTAYDSEQAMLETSLNQQQNALQSLANSNEIKQLLQDLYSENQPFCQPFSHYGVPASRRNIAYGRSLHHLFLRSTQLAMFEIPEYSSLLHITTVSSQGQAAVRRGMHALLTNVIRYSTPSPLPAAFVDCATYSKIGFEDLNALSIENSAAAFAKVPENLRDVLNLLKCINTFSDEESQTGNAADRYIVINGWERLAQTPEFVTLLDAPAHKNIHLVLIDAGNLSRQIEKELYDHSPTHVEEKGGKFYLKSDGENELRFYMMDTIRDRNVISSIIATYKQKETTYRYFDYVQLPNVPAYRRTPGGFPDFQLLYGVDKNGNPCVWNTMEPKPGEGYMFACYLLGASRSGKSTTINCILASLILNYHPDDAELWLADFKMESFKKYADNMPPHVKYILMDDSDDAIFSYLDSLYAEYEARKLRFGGKTIQEYRKAHPNEVVPYIFAIVDEFSIMAGAVSEHANYKNKLVSLLKLTGSYGFRYLFASQSYSGVEARALGAGINNINQRMCMYCNNKDEMKELLGGKNTDKIDLVSSLPVHKILDRVEIPKPFSGHFAARYVNALYMNPVDESRWFSWTRGLGQKIQYQNKEPQVFDPSIPMTYALASRDINACLNATSQSSMLRGMAHMCLCIGRPRSMEKACVIALRDKENENLLISANVNSRMQAEGCAAMLNGVIKCAAAYKYMPEIWAAEDDALLRAYRERVFDKLEGNLLKIYTGRSVKQRAIELARHVSRDEPLHHLIIVLEPTDLLKIDSASASGKQELKNLLNLDGASLRSESARDVFSVKSGISLSDLGFSASTPKNAAANEPDLGKLLRLLTQLAPQEGGHFVFLCASTVQLWREIEISHSVFTHRAAFQMRDGAERDADMVVKVNRSLKERERCFVYTDGVNYRIMEPYSLQ